MKRESTRENVSLRETVRHKTHKVTVYLSIDILQHDVLGFEVSVDDLVLVQVLDPRAWSGKQTILLRESAERRRSERRRKTLDIPTSLIKESTSLSFRPQQFSGLLSIWNPRKDNSYISGATLHKLQYNMTKKCHK